MSPRSRCIRASRAVHEARAAAELGARVTGAIVPDFAGATARMKRLRAEISRHDSARRFTGLGVDVFLGSARFMGPDTVDVDGARLRFSRAILASGSRPLVPVIPGLTEVGFFTNETIFSLTTAPRRLLVIGGGPVGCELAQAFRRLGSEVAIVSQGERLLPREDPDAGALLERQLAREGIRLLLGAEVRRIERTPNGAEGKTRPLPAEGSHDGRKSTATSS